MKLSLLHPSLHLPPLPSKHHHHPATTSTQAHLSSSSSSSKPLPRPQRLTVRAHECPKPAKNQHHQESSHLAASEGDDRTCVLPTWALLGGITLGVAAVLALTADAGPAAALGPEGPLVEEFWDNMRRYALYVVTVSTGVVYTVLQPIVELLKNPITALLILVVVVGSGFLVSQVLNAMVGNSDFVYKYD